MIEFVQAIFNPDNQFLRLAAIIGILASLSFGIVGTYVVTRRISYLAGAISHCVFGGIGASLYLQQKTGILWIKPMYGAVISALIAAIVIGFVSLHVKEREDTVIGALWAIGMAAGILFIDRTAGYFDMASYLFGDILLISYSDITLVACLDILVVFISLFFYNKLIAVCFDHEFARLRGINVDFYFIVLLCMTALTVVLLIRIVGIVMVIALLTIPSAIAGQFSKRLWQMMLFSTLFCMVFSCFGLAFSYKYRFSTGPSIIIIAGFSYLAVLIGSNLLKKFKK